MSLVVRSKCEKISPTVCELPVACSRDAISPTAGSLVAKKLSGPRAFQHVVMTVVAIVVVPFFVAIIIATWSGGRCGRSSAELLGTWSSWSWSELGGAAQDVVDVVRSRCSLYSSA